MAIARSALYICHQTVLDPLVQTQVIAYVRGLARRGVTMHLLTFERGHLDPAATARVHADLAAHGIEWHVLSYHGGSSFGSILRDIVQGVRRARRICARHGIRLIHARSHVPAAIALAVTRGGRAKFLFDLRGLLANEYADVGHWRPTDWRYRVTKAMERRFFRKADALVMLTETITRELLATEPALRGRARDIEVIPCCVDTTVFRRDPIDRDGFRRERGWQGRRVLVYAGKLGTWYLDEEMVRFFATARRLDSRCFFQVLTQSDPASLRRALARAGLAGADCDVRFVAAGELPRWLAAADGGLSFIRPSYSKRAASPTKVGEYLATGLTVVSSKGIGDCDAILARPHLGRTVDLSESSYAEAYGALRALWEDPRTPLACRSYAERELSLEAVGIPRYAAVYDRLLDRQPSAVAVP